MTRCPGAYTDTSASTLGTPPDPVVLVRLGRAQWVTFLAPCGNGWVACVPLAILPDGRRVPAVLDDSLDIDAVVLVRASEVRP